MAKVTTKVEVKLNDSTIRNVDVEDYNAADIAEQLNNPEKNMMSLGNIVVQRYSVVRITPADVNPVEDDSL